MRKVEICNVWCLTADIYIFFLRKYFLSSRLWFIWILSKSLYLIGCHGNIKGKFSKTYSEIFSSETIRGGVKLKLCIHVHDIILYSCPCAFVAMVTYSFHRLIMGKVKIGLYFYLNADILTKVFQKCSLSSPLPNIWVLSKPLNLIGCNANRNAKFAKKYSKIVSLEATRGIKLKLCRNVHNISLYIN